MSSDKKLYKLGRFLVYVLRHNPDKLNLELDSRGFVPLEHLASQLRQRGREWVDGEVLKKVVDNQKDKQRLVIEGDMIRAAYGHSARVIDDIDYSPATPPSLLYHGTPRKNIESIRKSGLLPGSRRYVHLTTSRELSAKVGRRHDADIVLLEVDSERAFQDGYSFYHPEPQIWLTEKVAVSYINFEVS